MSAYHLRKTEVKYELKIRGLPTEGNANELRKRFSQCCADNVQVDLAIVNSLDPDQELNECEGKLSDLTALVQDYEGNYNDNEFNRITARLHHLAMRIERIPIAPSLDLEPDLLRDELLKKTKDMIDSFTNAASRAEVTRRGAEDNKTPASTNIEEREPIPVGDIQEPVGTRDLAIGQRSAPSVNTNTGLNLTPNIQQDSSTGQPPRQEYLFQPQISCSNSRYKNLSVPVYCGGASSPSEPSTYFQAGWRP